MNKVKVHENDEIAMIRYSKKVVKSDHKVLELGLEIKVHIENKHESRVEVFNVRNKKCQGLFKEFTSKKGMFTNAFLSSEETIDIQYKRSKRNLNKAIHACFRKI